MVLVFDPKALEIDGHAIRVDRDRRCLADFGGPYPDYLDPAAAECRATSGANLFAAADLTLMRSLRTKNAVLLVKTRAAREFRTESRVRFHSLL
jgi:hypothetical protein